MEKLGRMAHFSRTNYLYFYLPALLPTEKISKRKKEKDKKKGQSLSNFLKIECFLNLYFEMKMQFLGENIFL